MRGGAWLGSLEQLLTERLGSLEQLTERLGSLEQLLAEPLGSLEQLTERQLKRVFDLADGSGNSGIKGVNASQRLRLSARPAAAAAYCALMAPAAASPGRPNGT
jgi:hypothetical protein